MTRDEHYIKLHVYIPPESQYPARDGFPVHLDFHGGSFTMGSCFEQAPFCSMLAREKGKIVISVDYRMGPSYQFPVAIQDGEDVLKAVLNPSSAAGSALREAILHKTAIRTDNDILDTSRISLSGFSSGGNLAFNLAFSADSDKGGWPSLLPTAVAGDRPVPMLLFYPSFDQTRLPHERTLPEHLQTPEGSKPSHMKLDDHLMPTYLPKDVREHPRSSPGLQDMSGLNKRTRFFLVLPEIDSLGPQAEEWVKKMGREGRGDDLVVKRYMGMKHGWTQFPDLFLKKNAKAEKRRAFQQALDYLDDIEATTVKRESSDDSDVEQRHVSTGS
ncbi:hypothetical protein MBLNU457_3841t1 [Dothideomycetes sp. NU457]